MGLLLLPKIKLEHIQLTPFSRMRVDLAAQVLQPVNTIWRSLQSVLFCSYLVKLLPRLWSYLVTLQCRRLPNSSPCLTSFLMLLMYPTTPQGVNKRKVFQQPYRSGDDFRSYAQLDMLLFLTVAKRGIFSFPRYLGAKCPGKTRFQC